MLVSELLWSIVYTNEPQGDRKTLRDLTKLTEDKTTQRALEGFDVHQWWINEDETSKNVRHFKRGKLSTIYSLFMS